MDLGLSGCLVGRMSFDSSVAILIGNGCELRIESEVILKGFGGGDVHVDPEDPGDKSPLLIRLINDVVSEASVDAFGGLLVRFSAGVAICIPPHAEFEAWGLVGPGDRRVTCMPGGELALWDGSAPRS